ncbi:Protein required for attachment to host cells [Methyloligella halotolerans]|uniref:Protein required for attachment to host cells n=2 Tax=Methyloligella halotolerans TaxID=1177755 RepID=A0A1E2RV41_9HYPH|nr:host attachment protein [Methyloligella halotolerans]ODA66094.1 Protein required for attachment to host cells [Methyloligella halotolerans]
MSSHGIPWKGWVVVCDGSKALMLRNEGDDELINLQVVEVDEEKHAATHEMGTDRPGRVQESAVTGRSAVEQTDWHERAEIEFLGRVAEKLDAMIDSHDIKHLVLVAPPRALGRIREQLTDKVKNVIDTEIDKDLTNLPVDQIEKHVTA